VESGSSRLPGCRAYELVSPGEAGKPVSTFESTAFAIGSQDGGNATPFGSAIGGPDLLPGGNLATQLSSPIDVQAAGSAVFWESQATPPGTGAVERGGGEEAGWNSFRSVRTPGGWVSKDLLPIAQQVLGVGGVNVGFLGASADGSTVLLATFVALPSSLSDFANPRQPEFGEWNGVILYRVSADGAFTPQLVTASERLLPANEDMPGAASGSRTTPFAALSASPDLSEIAFKSTIPFESSDKCNTSALTPNINFATTYLQNVNSLDGLARQLVLHPGCTTEEPIVAAVPTFLREGQPIITPGPGLKEAFGPGPVEYAPHGTQNPIIPLAGTSGGTLLSVTPDGSTAYVLTEGNVYAVSTRAGWERASTPCVSCATNQAGVTFTSMSADGSHVLFSTAAGLWEWNASEGARLLTSATDASAHTVVVSANGQYVVLLTSAALSAQDTNGSPDLYELTLGHAPVLLTSGISADRYVLNVEVHIGTGTVGGQAAAGGL
jgi:hypothetical protein